jgi:hypothetical protein
VEAKEQRGSPRAGSLPSWARLASRGAVSEQALDSAPAGVL